MEERVVTECEIGCMRQHDMIHQEMGKQLEVKWAACTSCDNQLDPCAARQEQPHRHDCVRLKIPVGQIAENEHARSHKERNLVKTTANA